MGRFERDSLGEVELNDDYIFGINTKRAERNFDFSGLRIDEDLFFSLIQVKKAAAFANVTSGILAENIGEKIIDACNCVLYDIKKYLPNIDPYQGGAGTSTNMAANELIANMALKSSEKKFGDYNFISPLDHVNLSQSTNDCYLTAIKITVLKELRKLEFAIRSLLKVLQKKENEFSSILKVGRTQLQDALPISLGQEFGAWAESIGRFRWRIEKAIDWIRDVNISGTAIGTSINASKKYSFYVIDELRQITKEPLALSRNLIDGTQNIDQLVEVSGIIKTGSVSIKKIVNDIRLLASGPNCGFGELILPKLQSGSSIMPGKTNPVMLEASIQICLQIIGNDTTISYAASESNLELTQYLPLIAHLLIMNLKLFSEMSKKLAIHIDGIQANNKNIKKHLNYSVAVATLLVPRLGYDNVSSLLQNPEAQKDGFLEFIIKNNILSKEELNTYLTPEVMASSGIPNTGDIR